MLLSIIKKLIISLSVGLIITLLIAQQSDYLKNRITSLVMNHQAFLTVSTHFTLAKINLFIPSIDLTDIHLYDKNQQWSCICKKAKCSLDWPHLILKQELRFTIKLIEPIITTHVDHQEIAIIEYIKNAMQSTKKNVKASCKLLELYKSSIRIIDTKKDYSIDANFSMICKEKNKEIKAIIHLHDGSIFFREQQRASHIKGSIAGSIYTNNVGALQATYTASATIEHQLQPETISVEGSINGQKIIGSIKSNENSITASNFIFDGEDNRFTCTSVFNIAFLKKFLPAYEQYMTQGTVNAKTIICSADKTIHAVIKNYGIKEYLIDEIDVSLHQAQHLDGKFTLQKNNLKFNGFFDLKNEKFFNMQAQSQSEILFPFLKFSTNPTDFNLKINSHDLKNFNGTFNITLQNMLEKRIPLNAHFFLNQHELLLHGSTPDFIINMLISQKKHVAIEYLDFIDKASSQNLLHCSGSQERIQCLIDATLIKKIIPKEYTHLFSGKGHFLITASYHHPKIKGFIKSDDCSIIVPNSYSIIKGINASFCYNIAKQQLTIKNLEITLNKGSIECKRGSLIFNNLHEMPSYINLPCIIKDLTINLKRELIGKISARMHIKKDFNDRSPTIESDIVIRTLFIKKLDMQDLDKNTPTEATSTFDAININASVINTQPILLKNEQLECKALVSLNIQGTVQKPEVQGNIEFISGHVAFPYKNLKIMHGKITMFDNNSTINIVAQNKIKKYIVTAHVYGDVKNPTITLSSSPTLNENQIGALLIAGSENASLNLSVPSIIMQHIQQLIIKSSDAESLLHKNKLLEPLKHIKLVSGLNDDNDQSIKGGVEIDVSDRLYALIEKNLNSNEQTSIEIDYMLSDDINIKGLRDKKGDLSGEIEMRWRF